jgi:hypothetical protein
VLVCELTWVVGKKEIIFCNWFANLSQKELQQTQERNRESEQRLREAHQRELQVCCFVFFFFGKSSHFLTAYKQKCMTGLASTACDIGTGSTTWIKERARPHSSRTF